MYNNGVEKRTERGRVGQSLTHNDTVGKRAERERVGQSPTCTTMEYRRGLKEGGLVNHSHVQ